ncbi:TrmH family RNA methyltransferase [Treponema brennaborense]|uniref:tRNA/rRNA methyltransferase (SpoU) n=1 Tax=Treponema brennaborense (strain DSM 12168 / CIP 105900 / DD5/3) TaxID=906968 RepID=F4LNE7_TREBD|nr:TrmH family RNA methyltransferase [Treponema brennaborense]AEE17905.1 tRNA/rRNA methyltransferase (SpoU) [Treponema brennaborense DSM 12168]
MIAPDKLSHLRGGQKRRKLALCFGALERDIAGIAEAGCGYSFPSLSRGEYVKKLARVVLEDPQLPPSAAGELERLLAADPFDERRVCNCARNHLLAVIGTFPAEWDLVIAPHRTEAAQSVCAERDFYRGVTVYAEDIRSPFNLGSIFRTAEAMGAERVLLSPGCADPAHSRALRSGMGCIETMPWERVPLEALPAGVPVFVLETGGTPLDEFAFPREGIVVIGSEELGVSPEALKRGTYGRVSIPMKGLKASLNVGVAFGILMQAWVRSLQGV